MKFLAESMKKFPNNLQYLEINLSNNNLGKNFYNIEYLLEGMKYLPKKLKCFRLDLR